MLEPTGVWEEEIENGIAPYQAALADVLVRHFGMTEPDDEVYRLCFSIVAMGVFMYMGREVMDKVRPSLLADHNAIDAMAAHFTRNALAMVHAQAAHRLVEPEFYSSPISVAPDPRVLA
jgi:hypothetical protein